LLALSSGTIKSVADGTSLEIPNFPSSTCYQLTFSPIDVHKNRLILWHDMEATKTNTRTDGRKAKCRSSPA
jgi:hypothetical protein